MKSITEVVQNLLKPYIDGKDNNIYEVMGENGAKNIEPNLISSGTYNTGTITVNEDKSVLINGSFSAVTTLNLDYVDGLSNAVLDLAPYIGKPLIYSLSDTEITGITVNIGYWTSGGTRTSLDTVATKKGITYPSGAIKAANYLRIAQGTYDNVTVYPMLRDAKDTDETYQPHAKTNQELTAENEALTNQVKDMNNVLGAKNILPFDLATIKAINTAGTWSGNAYTHNGVTFTPTFDSKGNLLYIDANGNATPYQALFYINSVTTGDSISLPNGNYIANGCPVGGANGTYKLDYAYQRSGVVIYNTDYGNGVEVALENDDKLHCYITIANNYTASHLKFYPMIRLASETDATYVPYAKTNQELTAENQTLTSQANAMANEYGSKNLLPQTGEASSYHGVDFTVNSDGTVNFSGTITDDSTTYNYAVNEPVPNAWKGNTVTFGAFKDTIADAYATLYLYDSSNNLIGQILTNGNDLKEANGTIPSNADHYIVQIVLQNNRAVSGILYPMVRDARIADSTYEPYAMTNQELTDLAIKTDIWTMQVTTSDNQAYYDAFGEYGGNASIATATGYSYAIWSKRIAAIVLSASDTGDGSVIYNASAGDTVKCSSFKPSRTVAISILVLYR